MRTFTITHPFHPLNGHRFEALETKFCWGEERVYFIDGDGVMQRLRVTWTSLETPDPFVATSAARSAFRVRDLLALADLVESLSGTGP